MKYTKNTFTRSRSPLPTKSTTFVKGLMDWYAIRDMSPRASPAHWPFTLDPIFGLYRGFGGKCLPKDSLALGVLAESLGVKYDIMDAMQRTTLACAKC